MARKLSIKKEILEELTTEELSGLAGGADVGVTGYTCVPRCPPTTGLACWTSYACTSTCPTNGTCTYRPTIPLDVCFRAVTDAIATP